MAVIASPFLYKDHFFSTRRPQGTVGLLVIDNSAGHWIELEGLACQTGDVALVLFTTVSKPATERTAPP
jgi:hypothetical protein